MGAFGLVRRWPESERAGNPERRGFRREAGGAREGLPPGAVRFPWQLGSRALI